MKHVHRAALLASALACVAPALGDDSSAMLGAGGVVVLTKNPDIRMASEDLYLSPQQVKVHYTFVNDGPKDVDLMVAFPLPDVDNAELAESPIGTTTGGGPNFVGFKLAVDGKPVTATAEERAIFKGKDVTGQVKAAGLPLNIVIGGYDALQHLPAPKQAALVKAGLIENIGDAANPTYHALWTTTTKFWWKMHFPAGKPVGVDHSYQPVTGQTFFGAYAFAPGEQNDFYVKGFCLDKPTTATIKARLADVKKATGNDGLLNQYTTDFVIVTANNWKGPIGKFHLTIDKLKPTNVLSMCWAGDLKKTSATRFESTLTNFAPKQDIQILVLEMPSPDQGGGY
ncbi:MAG: DUF4424 family protein [Rhizomicrobium sp.]